MLVLSCVNCSFNALQYDNLGTAVGYCGEHRRVLNTPALTTCGRLFRKDLMLRSAEREQGFHEARFAPSAISSLTTGKVVNGAHTSSSTADLAALARDAVAAEVMQYGQLGSKIESLARLSMLPKARAEIGLTSLGRTYVRRCVERGGVWSSGLHLFWWVKSRVAEEPDIHVDDLRESQALPLSRQMDLARWSVVMLRLTFLSDVAEHAVGTKNPIRAARDLPEQAARATQSLSFRKLMRWVERGEGRRILDRALTQRAYERLSERVHREEDRAGALAR
jgi:hypothetical protein